MIDKNKAYRFRGDNERWVVGSDSLGMLRLCCSAPGSMTFSCAEHLHERGILLEYPELPGEDWEFCERGDATEWWCNGCKKWHPDTYHSIICDATSQLYCRKKKPVITEFEVVVESLWATGDRIYLPSGFAGPGDKVKVTKL